MAYDAMLFALSDEEGGQPYVIAVGRSPRALVESLVPYLQQCLTVTPALKALWAKQIVRECNAYDGENLRSVYLTDHLPGSGGMSFALQAGLPEIGN